MLKISIDRAKAGMILAQDVINEAGMVIVPAGKELTDSLIAKLSRMNIDVIYIKGEKNLPPKEEVFNELEKRFQKITDNPTLLIKQAIKDHLEEMYQ